ncbi:hypothetical protein LPJ78_002991 [Coemansia sp. RSA 989]|nr:hypothetical protein LPJ68_004282 [Coemansia sp. RSA 1086]KAJ1865026.1 hypothetical protein LPJ78_002991 [Coemansia sp. RSA 989]KAJ1870465.1 hypothetical protein LPJ55_004635 [Coemansia sp. RSA 990]KAJ2669416.1 hypothetical protein IWW42_004619 [Coemansia sp. RSA 1085]
MNTSGASNSLQQLHETLTNSGFGQGRGIPLSPDVVPQLDAGQQLLVDASDQYLKPIARSNTPSSMEDCSRRSSVSSSGSKLGNTFVNKLNEMVNDSQYQHLISWNFSGTSFVVCNIMEFSRELLPKHFKHNNFSSFVRQLNMYGFHKVNKSPRGHRTMAENQIWEFSHPKFVRDRPDLLDQIKRKTMESESLRREAGDLHANFVMLQVSHTDLVKRVHHLQENLAEVIRELAETRKRQATQEGLVRQLLQALKQGGAAASLPQDLDMDAIASQSTRPSIFISDHDTNSLLHPELGYSASMSALGSQFHLGSGSLIATSQPPTSPISTIGQIGTALHHSASAQPLSIGPAPQQQGPRVASPQQVSQQSLRSALSAGGSLGSDNLGVYPRQNSGSLATSQPTSPAPFYSGASNSLSTSSLSSTDMKDVYNR